MAMSKEERKRLIAKAKEHEKIAQAIREEKQEIMNTPVHSMPKDPTLAHLPKYPRKPGQRCASDVIRARKENMEKGAALMNAEVEKTPEVAKDPVKETPKKTRGRSKRVE